jgi:hypothetical protein
MIYYFVKTELEHIYDQKTVDLPGGNYVLTNSTVLLCDIR